MRVVLLVLLIAVALGCGKKTEGTGTGADAPTDTTPAAKKSTPVTPTPPQDDIKAIQGKWQPVSIAGLPKLQDAESLEVFKAIEITVTGDRIKVKFPKMLSPDEAYQFVLAPNKSPKQADVVFLDKDGNPKTVMVTGGPTGGGKEPAIAVQLIYKLEGDTLLLAGCEYAYARPKEFKAGVMENVGIPITVNKRASTNVVVAELKRIK